MQLQKGGLLECREILHLISYKIPIEEASQIEMEVLDKVKQIRKIAGIAMNPYE